MKVGIVQNRIIYGGRLAVIVGIIEILNQRGIVPDLIAFQTKISPNGVYRQYGKQINFKIRRINAVLSKIPGEANILAFNLVLHKIYKKYDYFLNSSNTAFLMPSRIPIFSYVHFPRIARSKSPHMSIHFPNGPHKQWFSRQGAIAKLFDMLYSFQKVKSNNYVVTNSKFSRLYFQHYYPAYRQHIPVVYPPVTNSNDQITSFNERANIVCSIGRFCQEKNQLAQIVLAERLPDWKFKLIGFADENNPYLKNCQSYVNDKGLKNVKFELNVPQTRKRELLRLAKFFIHPNINEPFGITTAESVLNGCLPLVHNSGGQVEIVPIKELRFNAIEEIEEILGSLKGSDEKCSAMQQDLYHHCRTCFSTDVFKDKMRECIEYFDSNYLQ